jgi:hypothetical protein
VRYGDADPSNTSSVVRGAEMRVAETRAVNRAMRKADGIGLCSVEELGSHPFSSFEPKKQAHPPVAMVRSTYAFDFFPVRIQSTLIACDFPRATNTPRGGAL